jgi:hypothetical protein
VRPSSAATSSNSSGEILRLRCASSRPNSVLPGLVGVYLNGFGNFCLVLLRKEHDFAASCVWFADASPRARLSPRYLLCHFPVENRVHSNAAEEAMDKNAVSP